VEGGGKEDEQEEEKEKRKEEYSGKIGKSARYGLSL
jgi:hypothetical protein